MRINNNIAAINTHRQYSINNAAIAKSTEKLSSGYRINRAGDDAAGLAISEKMRAQIRGLNMASKNSQDAVSLIQTAEGALQETHNILQRMRELSTQAASDTNDNAVDRAALNAEFQQLKKEIDDTANKTKFNGMGVIDGTFQGAEITGTTTAGTKVDGNSITITGFEDLASGGYKLVFTKTEAGVDGTVELQTAAGATVAAAVPVAGAGKGQQATTLAAGDHTFSVGGVTVKVTLTDATATYGDMHTTVGPIAFTVAAATPLTIQTGANQGDELAVNISRMDAQRLGLGTADISNRTNASGAIELTNHAINQVSTQRAQLGALQNRLNHKIANLDTSAENLQAAESRIRDVDMAKEMTNFTRNNILAQASTAMLAQANSAPQGVLQLLS